MRMSLVKIILGGKAKFLPDFCLAISVYPITDPLSIYVLLHLGRFRLQNAHNVQRGEKCNDDVKIAMYLFVGNINRKINICTLEAISEKQINR